ncbi:substrate-binding domain-containing protein [Novosphingobium sp. KCTC 2891]|uniref:substrate-binding domain-containing protein n=1 Tax=Novosphingobium sp. KCTC 2891 TaxID=2989730 RepID=UPI002221C2C3|nr:substrate-binding domain-containing protein [Novosphingobium sp. KCTC 2891]MCW1381609.1 substrate-binding domain-containing protein [Novosphingobium sp. KCTC 2891]
MTDRYKAILLSAVAISGLAGGTARAQVTFPAAELHAMGASSVAVILPRELNCVGPDGVTKQTGKNDGSVSTVSEGKYTGVDAPFDCATRSIQKNIGGVYVSTGSGAGKTAWKNINASAFFTGAAGAVFPSAFGSTWSNPHFVMSDSPISAADISTFNSAAVGTKKAGAALQIPLYVLPVAVAYSPIYGRKVAEKIDLSFSLTHPVVVGGVKVGGLRLSKQVYCGIFNGYITNWNDNWIKALNTKTVNGVQVAVSLMDRKDSTTRWNTDGVPIRLVGRLDKSGTTDIFTRHLAASCNGGIMGAGKANNYLNAAEALPYSTSSGIDLTSFRADSPYKPSGTGFAGTANLISGAVFNGTAIDTSKGAEVAGKFLLADGSGKVVTAINLAADRPSANSANVLLNGKVGYVGADFVRPSAGQTLHAAALEQGLTNSTPNPVFRMPTALNAVSAFGTKILPPESDAAGRYVKGGTFSRSNPLDWYQALYAGEATLANPAQGYPITGTTQFVSATCFTSSAVRNALTTFLHASLGWTRADYAGGQVSAGMFTGTTAASFGLKAQMGVAPLPAAWRLAARETFLTRSLQKAADGTLLRDRKLYIQNGLPTATGLAKNKSNLVLAASDLPTTATSVVSGRTVYNEAGPNPNCTAGAGL